MVGGPSGAGAPSRLGVQRPGKFFDYRLRIGSIDKNLPPPVAQALLRVCPKDGTGVSLKFRAERSRDRFFFRRDLGTADVVFDLSSVQCPQVQPGQRVPCIISFNGADFTLSSPLFDLEAEVAVAAPAKHSDLPYLDCGRLHLVPGSEYTGLVIRWFDSKKGGSAFFVRLFADQESMEATRSLVQMGRHLQRPEETEAGREACIDGLMPERPGIRVGELVQVRVARIFTDQQGTKVSLAFVAHAS